MINSIHIIIEYYTKYYGECALNCCCKLIKDKAIYGGKIFLKNRAIFYREINTSLIIQRTTSQ